MAQGNFLQGMPQTITVADKVIGLKLKKGQGIAGACAQDGPQSRAFFGGRARSIESALADGRDWLVAGRFTIADIAVGYAAFLAQSVCAAAELGDATQVWLARCTARPAFLRARERQASTASD